MFALRRIGLVILAAFPVTSRAAAPRQPDRSPLDVVRHYADAMASSFVPDDLGAEYVFDWTSLAVVAAWGVAGLLLANRFFSWEPRR